MLSWFCSTSPDSIWEPWSSSIRKYLYHHMYFFRISTDPLNRKQIPSKMIWETLPKVLLGEVWTELRRWGKMRHLWQVLAGSCYHPPGLWLWGVLPGSWKAGTGEEGPTDAVVMREHGHFWKRLPGMGKELQKCVLTFFSKLLLGFSLASQGAQESASDA